MPTSVDPGRFRATVVGGGPGGLIAAEVLASAGVQVTVFERMPSVGRKFLLAGRGGLNLTHSEPIDSFLDRYGEARPRFEEAIGAFGPDDLRAWSASLEQETFVGTSGRVFPEALRATPLLRMWLRRLDALGVTIRVRQEWTGWAADGASSFRSTDGSDSIETVPADVTVLALGGASWPRVGSNGAWVHPLGASGVRISPLEPANGGFVAAWTDRFADKFAGKPLKNIALTHEGSRVRGEVMLTKTGIEGGAVYALSRDIRRAINTSWTTEVFVDLRPDLDEPEIEARLSRKRKKDTVTSALKRAGVSAAGIGLMREVTANELPHDAGGLAHLVKAVPVALVSSESIDRAISTAGGVDLDEIDDDFMLRRRPGTFVVGEMLDWDAPTGGYLLQATFSTGVAAARGALLWLRDRAADPADDDR